MSFPVRGLLRSEPAVIISFGLLALLFSLPVYTHLDYWGIRDWDMFLLRSSVSRDSILKYGQFPLWNPYSMGGMPHLAQPETNILSLPFLMELLFGVLVGNRINITLHLFIGLCGTYFLARHYRQEVLPAILAAFVFMFSSMYAITITAGMVSGYAISYIPWALFFFLKAIDEFIWVFAAVIALSLMWLSGGVYPFCVTMLFLGVYAIVCLLAREWKVDKVVRILLSIVVLSFLLGAVKFLPSIEFTSLYPRHFNSYAGLSLESLLHGLFGRDQTLAFPLGEPDSIRGLLNGFTWGKQETNMYIGYLPFLLFLAGCIWGPRNYRALIWCVFIFVWLALGQRTEPLSLWAVVKKIPPYSIMRTAERFRYVFMLGLAVLAGLGLQISSERLRRRYPNRVWSKWAEMVILIFILVDLFTVNSGVFKDAFPIPPIKVERSESFYQFTGSYEYDQHGFVENRQGDRIYTTNGASYPAFISNAGTILAYESMPVPYKAVPKFTPDYRGEVYLAGGRGQAFYQLWSPNRLIVEVKSDTPETLVINQNYYPGWHVKGGLRLESYKNLLAVKVDPSVRIVELYYRPTSFVIGALVSLATLIGIICWFVYLLRRSYVPPKIDLMEEK